MFAKVLRRSYLTAEGIKDYYKILGVPHTAQLDTIKETYRKLVKSTHPDIVGGDGSQFKEISEAYEAIGTEESRAKYDRECGRSPANKSPVHNRPSNFRGTWKPNYHTTQQSDEYEWTEDKEEWKPDPGHPMDFYPFSFVMAMLPFLCLGTFMFQTIKLEKK